MRTTININEHLLAELKERAASSGTTVSRLIEEAVRSALGSRDSQERKEFHLVTYGGTGRFTDLDLNKTSHLLEHDDVVRFSKR